jgi:hypothetical protein
MLLNPLSNTQLLKQQLKREVANNVSYSRLGYSREELCSMTLFDTNPLINMDGLLNYLDLIEKKGNLIYEAPFVTNLDWIIGVYPV